MKDDPLKAAEIASQLSAASLADAATEREAAGEAVQKVRKEFHLQSITEFINGPSIKWFLKGLMPRDGLGMIYGPSGAAKSFLAADLVYALATGRDWFLWKYSNTAKQNLPMVIYLVLEGAYGFRQRIKAFLLREDAALGYEMRPANIMFYEERFDITKADERDGLSAAILKAAAGRPVVCVIDTQAQASPALDENASRDMGELLKNIDEFKRAIGANGSFVWLIAHAGKKMDVETGSRGWSGLKAPLDVQIAVEKISPGKHKFTLAKQKDAADGQVCNFILQGRIVGQDEDGEPITSCTVEYVEDAGPFATEEEIQAVESLKAAYAGKEIVEGQWLPNMDWITQYAADMGLDQEKAKNKITYLARKLEERKAIDTKKEGPRKKFVRLL